MGLGQNKLLDVFLTELCGTEEEDASGCETHSEDQFISLDVWNLAKRKL